MKISDKPNESKPKFKLGIAFSGGGARGFAHAGALAAIEEAGLKPDIVAGVSAGSVVAVLYAAGIKPHEMPRLFANSGFGDFTELCLGQGGIFKLDRFRKFLMKSIAPYQLIEELPLPVFLGVTDFDNGVPAEFHNGSIGERVVASCSIPIVFKPIKINGVNYVDGGVLRNHPAWIIRDKCEKLIGLNVSPLKSAKTVDSMLNVALRTYNLMAKANQKNDMELCDLSVEMVEISHYKTFNLKHINNLFMSGYAHTRKMLRDAGMWQCDPINS